MMQLAVQSDQSLTLYMYVCVCVYYRECVLQMRVLERMRF